MNAANKRKDIIINKYKMPIIAYFARSIECALNYIYCGCKNKRNMATNIFVYVCERNICKKKKKAYLFLNDC